MYKNKKIILFAFASLDLIKSVNRLKAQAIKSNYYDEIKILSPKDFDQMSQMLAELDTFDPNPACSRLQVPAFADRENTGLACSRHH